MQTDAFILAMQFHEIKKRRGEIIFFEELETALKLRRNQNRFKKAIRDWREMVFENHSISLDARKGRGVGFYVLTESEEANLEKREAAALKRLIWNSLRRFACADPSNLTAEENERRDKILALYALRLVQTKTRTGSALWLRIEEEIDRRGSNLDSEEIS